MYFDLLSIQKEIKDNSTPGDLKIDESPLSDGEEGLSNEEKEAIRERKEAERQFNSGEKIICTICRKIFKTNFELQRHFRSHGLAFLKTSNNPVV